MVFETVIEKLTTKEQINAELERATIDKRALEKKRDIAIEQIRSDYVGGISKIDTYIEELKEKLEVLNDITLEKVDTKYPTASIVKA